MDLQFHGANCISINTKQLRVVVDDTLDDLGGKSVTKQGDVALFTGSHGDIPEKSKMVIDLPGEYEVLGVSIQGIAARTFMDGEDDKKNSIIYKIMFDDLSVLVTGHVYPELTESQQEAIGMVDVMFVPVGDGGYTLDGAGALKLIKKIEPKLVIPTHYDTKGLKFPVPQQSLDEAIKSLGMEPKERVEKLRLKHSDLESGTQLVILE